MSPRPFHHARIVAVLAAAGLLAGCMYDPYTGTYYPCCGNPYPYYGYPTYAPYYGYPYGYPPPPAEAPQPYGYATPPATATGQPLAQRFAEANVTHDGKLTQQQAEAANWQAVARNFPDIDIDQKGYVTLNEVRMWLETHQPPPPGTPG